MRNFWLQVAKSQMPYFSCHIPSYLLLRLFVPTDALGSVMQFLLPVHITLDLVYFYVLCYHVTEQRYIVFYCPALGLCRRTSLS